MISFENTEIAFQSKTDKDLRRAHFLFKMIGSNLLVSAGKTFSRAALKLHIPVGWAVKPTIYAHFVGGETIDECYESVRLLGKYGLLLLYS